MQSRALVWALVSEGGRLGESGNNSWDKLRRLRSTIAVIANPIAFFEFLPDMDDDIVMAMP
jgi:hypothetical protein